MNRLPRILALGVAALALAAGACSSSSDKASSDTTVTTASTSTTAKPSTTSTIRAASSTTTTAGSKTGCAQVTESSVKAARPDLSITSWTCSTGTEGSVWVGGTGVAGGGAADVNFIMVKGTGDTFTEATDAQMAACSNPPIPASLLEYCQSN